MAQTGHPFPQFALGAFTKLMNLNGSDSLMAALSNVASPVTLATPGIQAARSFNDWLNNVGPEIAGPGYTAGGLALTGVTVTVSGNTAILNCANPVWAGANFTASQMIIYDSSVPATGIQLICFFDFGGPIVTVNLPFSVSISGAGLLNATAT